MSDQHFSRAIILQVPILPMKLSSKLNRATRTSLACLAAVAALAIARHHAPDEASNHPRAHRGDAATRPGGMMVFRASPTYGSRAARCIIIARCGVLPGHRCRGPGQEDVPPPYRYNADGPRSPQRHRLLGRDDLIGQAARNLMSALPSKEFGTVAIRLRSRVV
jgi:hypothetical protein